MHTEYLMGNEAIALGALAAGVNVVAGYPGTPSTEVLETIAKRRGDTTYVEWSVNEKAAMELAAGAAYSGARALVTMKQVGLNVASDPLMSLEYVGVKGGMVILVADDPGPISSQTEQDTRRFAGFAKVPCFDPSSAEEAYSMIQDAFELSERYGTPVFLRPTTRVCHGYASLEVKDPEEYTVHKPEGFVKDSKRWVIFPKLSFANHQKIVQRDEKLAEEFSDYDGNYIESFPASDDDEISDVMEYVMGNRELFNTGLRIGIVASGISYAYAAEALERLVLRYPVDLLKIGTPYPFPDDLAADFLSDVDVVLCLEELDPVIEDEMFRVKAKTIARRTPEIYGKRKHTTAIAGEYTRDQIEEWIRFVLWEDFAVTDFLNEGLMTDEDKDPYPMGICWSGMKMEYFLRREFRQSCLSSESRDDSVDSSQDTMNTDPMAIESHSSAQIEGSDVLPPDLPVRPPVLCAGCPHRASFYAVKQAMKGKKSVFCGDIGCYTLGNAMPLDMVDTCLCMGAGVNIAQGIGRVDPDTNCFAFVGDSTFFASAITGVVNAVYNQANMTLIVLDNSTTAMTGHQPHPGTGQTMMGEIVAKVDMVQVLRGIGVQTVETVNPLCHKEAVETVARVAAEPGVKAIIFKYPCIALAGDFTKHLREVGPVRILSEKCIQCKKCIRELGCPALILKDGMVAIDETLCTGCGLCKQICPTGAIEGGDTPISCKLSVSETDSAADDTSGSSDAYVNGESLEHAVNADAPGDISQPTVNADAPADISNLSEGTRTPRLGDDPRRDGIYPKGGFRNA